MEHAQGNSESDAAATRIMNSGEPKCASVTTSSDNRRVLAGIIASGGETGQDLASGVAVWAATQRL